MPFIRVTALGPALTASQVSQLNVEVTGLMESVLGKVAELTSVLVEQPEAALDHWRHRDLGCGSRRCDGHGWHQHAGTESTFH